MIHAVLYDLLVVVWILKDWSPCGVRTFHKPITRRPSTRPLSISSCRTSSRNDGTNRDRGWSGNMMRCACASASTFFRISSSGMDFSDSSFPHGSIRNSFSSKMTEKSARLRLCLKGAEYSWNHFDTITGMHPTWTCVSKCVWLGLGCGCGYYVWRRRTCDCVSDNVKERTHCKIIIIISI